MACAMADAEGVGAYKPLSSSLMPISISIALFEPGLVSSVPLCLAGTNTGKSDGGKTCAKAFVHCGILKPVKAHHLGSRLRWVAEADPVMATGGATRSKVATRLRRGSIQMTTSMPMRWVASPC